ncbi:MAG: phosphoribosylanthranilate isomerase [Pseudomonadota bacterium]
MTHLWVKVCGLREERHVNAAMNAGCDAIGFVFADSPREIDPRDAAKLARRAGPTLKTVAVMRHPDDARWQRVLRHFRPDYLQTDIDDYTALDVPDDVARLPVFRDTRAPKPGELSTAAPVLYEGALSGSGQSADWHRAAEVARHCPVVLAGGLSVDNLAAAVKAVKPWGVDVSSGIEKKRGLKDAALIDQFIRTARQL